MSLESKARTTRWIWEKAGNIKAYDVTYDFDLRTKWVRLEDAQKAIQELEKQCIEINRVANEILQKKQRLESCLEKLREHLEMILTQFRQYKDAEILEVNADYVEVKLEKALKFIEEVSET